MHIKNNKRNTFNSILAEIWNMLEKGAIHSDDPFHWPVLGTSANEGCRLRTVILRQVDKTHRTLVCHTDARAKKVQEIKNDARTGWLFYHPAKKIQVRVSGRATWHANDAFADQQWADTGITSRLNYCASQAPGTPVNKPSSGLPDFLLNKVPTLLETERGRKHFMAIKVHICSMDWLVLKLTGNIRARFEWGKKGLQATWLVP